MNKDARIFIKENVTEKGPTVLVEGDYKGAADLSLARSLDCFKAVIARAGYDTLVCEKWYADEDTLPILTVSLKMVELKPRPRHTDCYGSKDPSEWTTFATNQKQEQQEEVKKEA